MLLFKIIPIIYLRKLNMAIKSRCVVNFFLQIDHLIGFLWFTNHRCFFFKPCGRSRTFSSFFCLTREFSLVWRRHHCRWRAADFVLCSALSAIDQWGFFMLPHLLWHVTSVYDGHIRWPMTLILIAEHCAVGLSLYLFYTFVVVVVVVNFLHFRLLHNHWPRSTKLGTKYLWVKGIQVCSNEGSSPFKGKIITK